MAWENSLLAFESVDLGISLKRDLTLESLDALTNKEEGINRIIVCESAASGADRFIEKIDSANDDLQSISVDTGRIEEFYKRIYNNIPASSGKYVAFVDPNNTCRINTSYFNNTLKKISKEFDSIVSDNKIELKMGSFDSYSIDGIKRQVVNGSYCGTNTKECFSNRPNETNYTINSMFIQKIALPFIKSFPEKKKEIDKEVKDVKNMISFSYSVLSSMIAYAKDNATTPEKIRQLNLYLTWVGGMISDVVSFTTYMLIRKIDIFIFDVKSLNEVYDELESVSTSKISVESVEDKEPPAYTPDKINNLYGILNGCYNRLMYDLRNFLSESDGVNYNDITNLTDKYSDISCPCDKIIDALGIISNRVETFSKKIYRDYPTPMQDSRDLNLDNQFTETFSDILDDMNDVSFYLNSNIYAKIDTTIKAIGEINRALIICKPLQSFFENIHISLSNILLAAKTLTGNGIDDNVIGEINEVVDSISENLDFFIAEILSAMDKRYTTISSHMSEKLHKPIVVVPELPYQGKDYFASAMESVLEDEKLFDAYEIAIARNRYARAKLNNIYGIYTEAEKTEEEKSNTPEVTENKDKMSDADKKKNEDAAKSDAGNDDDDNSDNKEKSTTTDATKNRSEMNKLTNSLYVSLSNFFDKMISHFQNALSDVSCRKQKNNFESHKNSILSRSYNGVELVIGNYPKLERSKLESEIKSVQSAVSALDASSLKDKKEEDLQRDIVKFMNIPSDSNVDGFIKKYYKGSDDNKNEEKTKYSGAELKTFVSDTMIPFCEDFYGDGRRVITDALTNLKTTTMSKIKSMNSSNDINPKLLRIMNREVQLFAGALLSGYRNMGKQYMSGLMALVPKDTSSSENKNKNENNDEESDENKE